MSSTKMNVFLQRMLRKSDEELNVENENEKQGRNEITVSKGNWIKRLGNYSPNKYKVPESPSRTDRMRSLDSSGLCDTYEATTPKKTLKTSPLEMPDLESIIREFEMGFLSPTKQETMAEASKQRNFVKKIVAAFEVKYKVYDDQKHELEAKQAEQEKRERRREEESRVRRSGFLESPQKRSGIFSSPFKSHEGKNSDKFNDPSSPNGREQNRRSGIFSTPTKNNSDDLKSIRRSGIFSSPFNPRSTSKDPNRRSGIYASPVKLDEDSTVTCAEDSSFFKIDNEESKNQRSDVFFSPVKAGFLDETKTIDSIDLEVTLPEPEETILLDENALQATSTVGDFSKYKTEDPRPSNSDKTPKIVGAFLKKPIEVEDTSIDWIPITGKKLPRKKSLKKLLSSLTSKKSFDKKSKLLFSSESNLNDDSRELQDSGYDEKSCSSSSLTSLISISEVLLQQENSYAEPEQRAVLRTFRSRNSLNEDEDEAFCDAYSSVRSKRKLLLTEVPRENLKLDLGPSFPNSSKILTMSLDRRAAPKPKNRTPPPKFLPLSRVPKHPFLSGIPKHPFVSMTRMDDLVESPESPGSSSIVIKNDLYEVEFRRSCEEFRSTTSFRGSSSGENNYDVPRRFLSRSESGIPGACGSSEAKRENEPVYDIPRSTFFGRPRSSVYEDALSLKRRTAHLNVQAAPDFYAFACDNEPHYATVKPRNRRVYLSQEMLKFESDLNVKISSF